MVEWHDHSSMWSRHQPYLHLAHLWPISWCAPLGRREARIPPLPSLTFPLLPHIRLQEKKNRNIQWCEKSPDTEIVIISPLHSSIPNTFLQKQIYGNPPDAYPLPLSKPHEGSQTCFFSPFCISKNGSTTPLCSVIITSRGLLFTHTFTALLLRWFHMILTPEDEHALIGLHV